MHIFGSRGHITNRVNLLKNYIYSLRLKNVTVGHINKAAAFTGFSYKKRYIHVSVFCWDEKSGHINKVTVLTK